jgi:L,D-transpeptidase YcbB
MAWICIDCATPVQPKAAAFFDRGATGATVALQRPDADLATAIRTDVNSPTLVGSTATEQRELEALYGMGAYAPLWVGDAGLPGSAAHEALSLLREARNEGLDPADYASEELDRRLSALAIGRLPKTHDVARFDVVLSSALLRYLRHLHMGRVDPQTMGFKLSATADRPDFTALVRSAVAHNRIAETAAQLKPALPQYEALRAMLIRYRSLASDTTFEPLPTSPAVLRPGDAYVGLNTLRRRLMAFGDLPAGTRASMVTGIYEGDVVEGVRWFQVRHGLESDGMLGKGTWAALEVPPGIRVRQIELALERLRWLPSLTERSLIAINIPMFLLWAWDFMPQDGTASLGMRVIVGRALKTPTPVFDAELREVLFRPYWNVPRSILRNEILPALRRDPGYLDREDMEIVRGPGDDATRVALTNENLALLQQGKLRVRQRPGPSNALGLVKFVFPNEADVYMHGTPAQRLFAQSRRDFSHGCVRVEDPVSLAEWALKGNQEWTRERILSAMGGTRTFGVHLAQPIRVILFYTTAVVMPEDGTVRFAEDIYRLDARLEQALARRHSVR